MLETVSLPNGGTATSYPDHADLPARVVRVGQLVVDLAADGLRLRLALPRRDQLAATAIAAGSKLADTLPASIVLFLAVMAVSGDLPNANTIALLHYSAPQMLPPHVERRAENATLGEIRSFVREAITAGPQQHNVDTALRVPAGRWNVARAILLYGEELWRVRGTTAAWWGSSIINENPAAQGAILLHLATTAMEPVTSPIPVPLAAGRPGEAIIDYLAVAGGPDPIPADLYDRGMGATLPAVDALFFGNASEERAIGWQQATELSRLAISILRNIDRPAPRYVGQSLTVALPPDLLPKLGAFGVVGMRVYPRATGMYCDL